MALLNKYHVKSLVAVGSKDINGNFKCDSTSFLVGFLFQNSPDPAARLYQTFLVTNRHVFENRKSVSLRFNTKDERNLIFDQSLFSQSGEALWLTHPNPDVDLALLYASPSVLKATNIEPIFISEEIFAYSNDFDNIGISVGDDVYAIGFPMGIAGETQNYPIVKAGLISRIDKEILVSKKAFIIDSSIFPGNSGGPVVLKPQIAYLNDTKMVNEPKLLGVISGYLPYVDNLYTHQTTPPTIVSTTRENSGLSFCVPMDFVKEIYDSWVEKHKKLENPQKNTIPENISEEVKTAIK